ncbi:CHRD domain-containing protein [Mariniblastus sp.]|nr:CHRD domain-containing protein [Mariniblastus sp.]
MSLTTSVSSAQTDPLVWIFDINEQSVRNGPEADGSTNSPGSGFGTVTLDTETNLLSYDFTWSDLFGDLTKLHIHGPASADMSNPQHIVEIFGPPEVPTELATTSGTVSGSFVLQTLEQEGFDPLSPDFITETLTNGQAYLNVHTTVFGMGEIRGNLGTPVTQTVPEPNSFLVFGLGFAALALRRRANPIS